MGSGGLVVICSLLFWSFKVVRTSHLITVSGIKSISSHRMYSLATILKNCRHPKGSSMGYIFFYFENSINICDI